MRTLLICYILCILMSGCKEESLPPDPAKEVSITITSDTSGNNLVSLGCTTSFSFASSSNLKYRIALSPVESGILKLNDSAYRGEERASVPGVPVNVSFTAQRKGTAEIRIIPSDGFQSEEKIMIYKIVNESAALSLFPDAAGIKDIETYKGNLYSLRVSKPGYKGTFRYTITQVSDSRNFPEFPYKHSLLKINGADYSGEELVSKADSVIRMEFTAIAAGRHSLILTFTDDLAASITDTINFLAKVPYELKEVPVHLILEKTESDNLEHTFNFNRPNLLEIKFGELSYRYKTFSGSYLLGKAEEDGIITSFPGNRIITIPASQLSVSVNLGMLRVPDFSTNTDNAKYNYLCHTDPYLYFPAGIIDDTDLIPGVIKLGDSTLVKLKYRDGTEKILIRTGPSSGLSGGLEVIRLGDSWRTADISSLEITCILKTKQVAVPGEITLTASGLPEKLTVGKKTSFRLTVSQPGHSGSFRFKVSCMEDSLRINGRECNEDDIYESDFQNTDISFRPSSMPGNHDIAFKFYDPSGKVKVKTLDLGVPQREYIELPAECVLERETSNSGQYELRSMFRYSNYVTGETSTLDAGKADLKLSPDGERKVSLSIGKVRLFRLDLGIGVLVLKADNTSILWKGSPAQRAEFWCEIVGKDGNPISRSSISQVGTSGIFSGDRSWGFAADFDPARISRFEDAAGSKVIIHYQLTNK